MRLPPEQNSWVNCFIIAFVLRSAFRNFGYAEITLHSEKPKYIWLFFRFFVTLSLKWRTYSVSAKKEMNFFCFALDFS
jgi:hypothetical protein